MSVFGGLILTNKGRNLQIKAQAGAQLNYTKVSIGDGSLGSSSIVDLVALKNKIMDLPITKLKVLTTGKAVIGTVLSNQNINTGFDFREIGIFATDPDLGEILYCYGNASVNSEYIPAGGGPDIIEKSIDINVLVGNATNITATIDNSLIYVTKPEYDADINQINQTLEEHDTKLDDLIFETAGGTGTAIVVTLPTTLVTGYPKTFIASANNGGAATTINGKKLYKPATTTSPNLIAGKAYTVWYNSTGDSGNGCFFIKASAEGDAVEANVLATKKFSNDNDTGLTGTMPNNGAVTITPGTTNKAIVQGYHNGSGYVAGDADLVSANIKAGANIFGVAGNVNVVDTSAGTATASQILSGAIAFVDGAQVTGTIASKTAQTYTPTTTNQTIASGQYLSGVQTIAGDADLISANILSGKSIFGVSGNVTKLISASGTSPSYDSSGTQVTSTGRYLYFSSIGFTPKILFGTYSDSSQTKDFIYILSDSGKYYNFVYRYGSGYFAENTYAGSTTKAMVFEYNTASNANYGNVTWYAYTW